MHFLKTYLLRFFKTNNILVHRQLQGVTHAESLVQPPARGNCLNWVVGHMLTSRGACLKLLGQEPVLSATELEVYDRGSEPLTGPGRETDIALLLEKLDRSLALLTAAIEPLTEAQLEERVEYFNPPGTLASTLAFLQWHETYHLGQLELLRQLTGKNDQIL